MSTVFTSCDSQLVNFYNFFTKTAGDFLRKNVFADIISHGYHGYHGYCPEASWHKYVV